MKKNNTLKVLLIAILFTFLLTWLLPVTYFNSELMTDARYQAGLFDIFNYPTLTFYYFGTTAIYVLVVGAFYEVFNMFPVSIIGVVAKNLVLIRAISHSILLTFPKSLHRS